jgi:hypothetical protein
MVWNSLMMSSRLVLARLNIPVDYRDFHYSALATVVLIFEGHYLCNNYTLFVAFDIL